MRWLLAPMLLLLAAAAPAQSSPQPSPLASPDPGPHKAHPAPAKHRPTAKRAPQPFALRQGGTPGPAFTAAPVPNTAATAPVSPTESRTHAEPTLFDLGTKYTGDGYVYGSSPQAMDDRRAQKAPGVEVKVPLK
jgi:hypothetical protein